jgi:hypothetical protein
VLFRCFPVFFLSPFIIWIKEDYWFVSDNFAEVVSLNFIWKTNKKLEKQKQVITTKELEFVYIVDYIDRLLYTEASLYC